MGCLAVGRQRHSGACKRQLVTIIGWRGNEATTNKNTDRDLFYINSRADRRFVATAMMEEAPLTNAVAGNEITATACDVVADEDKGATSMNLTSSLEQQRQWFLHLSPEERAAVLGFVDGRMVTVLAKAVASSLPTSGLEPAVVVGASDDAVNNGAVKQEALGTERMTGRRCVSGECFFLREVYVALLWGVVRDCVSSVA